MNTDLRRKNNTQRKQARALLEEKSELEIALREKDAEVDKVKIMLSEQEKFEEQRAAVRAAIQEQRESEEVSKMMIMWLHYCQALISKISSHSFESMNQLHTASMRVMHASMHRSAV